MNPRDSSRRAGDQVNIVERQAEADLEKFKQFIESRGAETGGCETLSTRAP